jgi:ketosteroid isomerase-like protein
MKGALMCFALLLATLAVQGQKSEKTNGGAEIAVANLEQQWVAAVKAGNFDFVATLLPDNFTEMDSDGSMHDKAEYLGWIKGSKWEVNEVSDVKVTAHGNTAVATGAWRGKGVPGNGTSVDAHERYMDTWMKMPSGKWQCIASASAPEKR